MTEKTFTRFLTAVTFVLLMMLILMPNANARSNVYDICEEICTEDYIMINFLERKWSSIIG